MQFKKCLGETLEGRGGAIWVALPQNVSGHFFVNLFFLFINIFSLRKIFSLPSSVTGILRVHLVSGFSTIVLPISRLRRAIY